MVTLAMGVRVRGSQGMEVVAVVGGPGAEALGRANAASSVLSALGDAFLSRCLAQEGVLSADEIMAYLVQFPCALNKLLGLSSTVVQSPLGRSTSWMYTQCYDIGGHQWPVIKVMRLATVVCEEVTSFGSRPWEALLPAEVGKVLDASGRAVSEEALRALEGCEQLGGRGGWRAYLVRGAVARERLRVKRVKSVGSQPTLHECVTRRDLAGARALLEGGSRADRRDRTGCTPLHRAVQSRDSDMASLLLEHGADPDARDALGYTPLHLALGPQRSRASRSRDDSVIPSPGSPVALTRLLAAAGADLNARDGKGYSPLHCAVMRNDPAAVQLLVRHGADPHLRDESTFTPLHAAVFSGKSRALLALLEEGVDPDGRSEGRFTPLCLAADINATHAVNLLLRAGANPRSGTVNWTPLHIAASRGNLATVRALLRAGGDANLPGAHGCTPLHAACLTRRKVLIEEFLKAGADLKARDVTGRTPEDMIVEWLRSSHGRPWAEYWFLNYYGPKLHTSLRFL